MAKQKEFQGVLQSNEVQAAHYEELLKNFRERPTPFQPVIEQVEALLPGLPEGHWMRTYLQTAVPAVHNNENLTNHDRAKFVYSMVKSLTEINEALKKKQGGT